jgi:NAD-dependent dihydropyrimidine dehydrogenase PreA subunit
VDGVISLMAGVKRGLAMRFRVSVDPERCVGCGAYPVKPENCKGYKDCLEECEVKAISVIHI